MQINNLKIDYRSSNLLFCFALLISICIQLCISAYTYIHACPKVLVAQLCLTLCNPVDCSPPGSSVHGILQERILERVAIPFSRGYSQPRIEPRSPSLQKDSLLSEPLHTYILQDQNHTITVSFKNFQCLHIIILYGCVQYYYIVPLL